MTEVVLVHLIQLTVPSARENKGTDCAFACTKHYVYTVCSVQRYILYICVYIVCSVQQL